MDKYSRVLALLTQKQADFLEEMSKEGYSKVEMIRRALDLLMEKYDETKKANKQEK